MVPLVGGLWGEVKLLAIGEVGAARWEGDEWVVHTDALSYFSRMTDAQTFGEVARVETHRRSIERAGVVCAVMDGAEWLQGLIDVHRPDAVRILDFAHAAGYVTRAAQAVFEPEHAAGVAWTAAQLHELKWGEAARVVAAVRDLPSAGCTAEARAAVAESVGYLTKRLAQMQYATFRALSYPIGSGSVESGHKVVTQARLAGAGMHWARGSVNALCARCVRWRAMHAGKKRGPRWWSGCARRSTIAWTTAARCDGRRRHQRQRRATPPGPLRCRPTRNARPHAPRPEPRGDPPPTIRGDGIPVTPPLHFLHARNSDGHTLLPNARTIAAHHQRTAG